MFYEFLRIDIRFLSIVLKRHTCLISLVKTGIRCVQDFCARRVSRKLTLKRNRKILGVAVDAEYVSRPVEQRSMEHLPNVLPKQNREALSHVVIHHKTP